MKKSTLVLIILVLTVHLFANVTLPKIFGDNMVLQRNKPIPVWGWAAANEKIVVQFNNQVKNIKADKSGKWMVKLDETPAGGPFTLVVKGKNTITFSDVL